MKILFANEYFPFPPRHGVELPTALFMEGLGARHEVSFVLIRASGDAAESLQRMRDAGALPWRVDVLPCRRTGRLAAAFDEVRLRRPTYCALDFDLDDIRAVCSGDEDIVFASPAGGSRFLEAYRAAFPHARARLVLGISDATHTAYLDHAMEVLRGTILPNPLMALRLLRVPWIALHERRYLRRVDAVHVQTRREARRIHRLLGRGARPRVVVAPTGGDESLLDVPYTGSQSRDLLFMTHLVEERAQQALWFLRRVWPLVRRRHPDARVFLFGIPAPADLAREIDRIPGVVQAGFAPTLGEAYAGKALSLVPVRQTSGLVQKVVDSLAAGVPVAGLSALSTVDGFENGVHGRLARSGPSLAAAVCEMMDDPAGLRRMSTAGRALAGRFGRAAAVDAVERALLELTASTGS